MGCIYYCPYCKRGAPKWHIIDHEKARKKKFLYDDWEEDL
jgi:hypothetical protein